MGGVTLMVGESRKKRPSILVILMVGSFAGACDDCARDPFNEERLGDYEGEIRPDLALGGTTVLNLRESLHRNGSNEGDCSYAGELTIRDPNSGQIFQDDIFMGLEGGVFYYDDNLRGAWPDAPPWEPYSVLQLRPIVREGKSAHGETVVDTTIYLKEHDGRITHLAGSIGQHQALSAWIRNHGGSCRQSSIQRCTISYADHCKKPDTLDVSQCDRVDTSECSPVSGVQCPRTESGCEIQGEESGLAGQGVRILCAQCEMLPTKVCDPLVTGEYWIRKR